MPKDIPSSKSGDTTKAPSPVAVNRTGVGSKEQQRPPARHGLVGVQTHRSINRPLKQPAQGSRPLPTAARPGPTRVAAEGLLVKHHGVR